MAEAKAMTIKTVGRFFPHREPPIGVWSAGLQWPTSGGERKTQFLHGESREFATNGHNIGADVFAVLAGLRFALRLGLAVEVYTVNSSVRDTIAHHYDAWKANGWRNSKRRRPHCLTEWQEIKSITEEIPVTWHKRASTNVDKITDYDHWMGWLSDPDDAYLCERAIARDPWG